MKQFLSVDDVPDLNSRVEEGLFLKQRPWAAAELGRGKTLGLVFFNPSLRTRLSSQKAAWHLGLNVLSINVNQEGWAIETQDGVVMDGGKVEHLKEAAGVLAQYCDMIGVRAFPTLTDRQADDSEDLIRRFAHYAQKPIVSLESATLHPLQSLADVMTIMEHRKHRRPKVVLSWAPHPKVLPQAVAHSFAQWVLRTDCELIITHPPGYELNPRFTEGAQIIYDQNEALHAADFVYVKNWSTYEPYGQILCEDRSWTVDEAKMRRTRDGHVMHCLPVRRNMELADDVLDSPRSLVLQQAHNRVFAAQAVLKRMLTAMH
jgi:N-succinyl-L-ornithine transcarbamylase